MHWRRRSGHLHKIDPFSLPERVFTGGMRQILQRRLAQVPEEYQPLLQLAATAGRQLDLKIMRHLEEQNLDEWLSACTDCAVLEMWDQQWRFSHDKLREAVLQDVSRDNKPKLNRTVAETIEAVYPDDENYNDALLEHWHQAGDLDREIHYLNLVADHLVHASREYQLAEQLLERGLNQLPSGDPRQVSLWNIRASSFNLRGKYEQAQTLAKQILNLAEQTGDQSGIAQSLACLGKSAEGLGDYEQARVFLQQALEIFQAIDDQQGVIANLIDLGNVTRYLGDYTQARTLFNQSLSISETIGNQYGIVWTLNCMGLLVSDLGDYQRAIGCYERTLNISKKIGDQYAIGWSLRNLGEMVYFLGDYEQAQDYLLEVLEIRHSLGDQRGIASTLQGLGSIAREMGDYKQAHLYYQQSLEVFQTIGAQENIADLYNTMGVGSYCQENYEQAYDYHQQSLAIFRKIGSRLGIAIALARIGFVLLKLRPKQAMQSFQESLEIAESIQAIPAVLENLPGFAWIYLQKGDALRSAELARLVQHHRVTNAEIRRRLQDLLPGLKATLEADELQAALERGKELDLDTVVQELLKEFSGES